jgi:N-hydroxyarylamine O-acetyltransferase
MTSASRQTGLSADLRDRVLERLGFAAPPAPDLEGLRALYRAWCCHIPFDNLRKLIALRTDAARPLPGGDAEDFFVSWLRHGCGGTCWPGSNALFALFHAAGFAARRIVASMGDNGAANHGSVKVAIDGRDWLVDSSLLTLIPLPLSEDLFMERGPLLAIEVEPEDGTHVVWIDTPPNPAYLCCRLLSDPTDHATYLTAYETSRERSPFNQQLYARRHRPDRVAVLRGHTRTVRNAEGTASGELTREEVRAALHDDFGYSEELIENWVRSGSLEASFEPPSGPKPPPPTRKPPSQR